MAAVSSQAELIHHLITLENSYKWTRRFSRGDKMLTHAASDATTSDFPGATRPIPPAYTHAFKADTSNRAGTNHPPLAGPAEYPRPRGVAPGCGTGSAPSRWVLL